jgi:hypothetical protein
MALDADLARRAKAYAGLLGESRPEAQEVLDDLVTQAGQQADPLVRAGYTLAILRILSMRTLTRRQARRG